MITTSWRGFHLGTKFYLENESFAIEDNISKIAEKFEDIEEGSGIKLKKFIESAKINYEIAGKILCLGQVFTLRISYKNHKKSICF